MGFEIIGEITDIGTIAVGASIREIVRLRKLFEPDPERPRHLLTVRGEGYRFVP